MAALDFRLSTSLMLLPFFRLSLAIKINSFFLFYIKNHILGTPYPASPFSRPQEIFKEFLHCDFSYRPGTNTHTRKETASLWATISVTTRRLTRPQEFPMLHRGSAWPAPLDHDELLDSFCFCIFPFRPRSPLAPVRVQARAECNSDVIRKTGRT